MRYSGILALASAFVTLLVTLTKAHYSLLEKRPLSELAATGHTILFEIGMLLTAVLFLVFLSYIKKSYNVSSTFQRVYKTSMLGLVTVALVPARPDSKIQYIHFIAAWVFVLFITWSLWLFYKSSPGTKAGKISKLIFLVICLALPIEILLSILGLASATSQLFNSLLISYWIVYLTFHNKKPTTP